MIPKICHFIWTNGAKMSLLQMISPFSFFKYNNDWQIIIHLIKQTPDELADQNYVPEYTGIDYSTNIYDFFSIKEVDLRKENIRTDITGIQASDLLRMKILYKTGGVYSDFDMLWLRSMDEFEKNFETTVCYYHKTGQHYNMSNIISEPAGGFLKEIISKQSKVQPPFGYQAFLTELFNREYPNPFLIKQRFPRVNLIDYKLFYPYCIYEIEKLWLKDDISLTKGAFGVHWFNGHHLSKDYVNKEDFNRKCSMTSLLRREGYV